MFDLEYPGRLSPEQWSVVQDHLGRIRRARAERDWHLGIGSAKELCESVAKLALDARGVTTVPSKFPGLIAAAHEVLENPRGEDIASDGPTKHIVKQAKTMVLNLGELRNAFGTGHGQAVPIIAKAEHADISLDAAVLWSRWALRRLTAVAEGRHGELMSDLVNLKTFRGGELGGRLAAVNIPSLDPEEQYALGVAVGRRAASGTFVVREDGMAVAARSDDHETWPSPYRRGAIEGSLLSADGRLRTDDWVIPLLQPLATGLTPEDADRLAVFCQQLSDVEVSWAHSQDRSAIATAIERELAEATHAGVADLLAVLKERLGTAA